MGKVEDVLAKIQEGTPVVQELPPGIEELKTYRDGRRLVVCTHAQLDDRTKGLGKICAFCRFSPGSGTPGWPPVKMVIRVFGKYPEWARVETRKLKAWLRHWKKQVAAGETDLVYDPEFEVKKLTEELLARGEA